MNGLAPSAFRCSTAAFAITSMLTMPRLPTVSATLWPGLIGSARLPSACRTAAGDVLEHRPGELLLHPGHAGNVGRARNAGQPHRGPPRTMGLTSTSGASCVTLPPPIFSLPCHFRATRFRASLEVILPASRRRRSSRSSPPVRHLRCRGPPGGALGARSPSSRSRPRPGSLRPGRRPLDTPGTVTRRYTSAVEAPQGPKLRDFGLDLIGSGP